MHDSHARFAIILLNMTYRALQPENTQRVKKNMKCQNLQIFAQYNNYSHILTAAKTTTKK